MENVREVTGSEKMRVLEEMFQQESAEVELNKRQFPAGSVVYFTERNGAEMNILFGIVTNNYATELVVELYEPAIERFIDGVSEKEFKTPTRWKKLPKNWSYDTQLFELTYGDMPEESKELRIDKPEDIIEAIQKGIIVKVADVDHCKFEAVIDSKLGWQIVRKYDSKYCPTWKSLPLDKCYKNYTDATKVVDDFYAELEKQRNMTDEEWFDKDVNDVLTRAVRLGFVSKEEAMEMKERFVEMEKPEEIDVRLFSGNVQYKRDGNKRWISM